MREDRGITDLLDATSRSSTRNSPGTTASRGEGQGVRAGEGGGHRGGILTHASILTLASNATRTSPVKRGKFVLEQLLNTPPPPPPPELDIPELEEQKQLKGTLRQWSSTGPTPCARRATSGWTRSGSRSRTSTRSGCGEKDAGVRVDASGVLPDGRKFDGPAGLRKPCGRTGTCSCGASREDADLRPGPGLEHYDRPW